MTTTIRSMQKNEAEIVRDLWNANCIDAVGQGLSEFSYTQVLKNLIQYADHKQCFCLVADVAGELVAFVTFRLLDHPIEPGYAGEIEEHYVKAAYRESTVMADLVKTAVIRLKQLGAGVIITRTAVDDPAGIAFWHSLKWEQDTINFAIYGDIPADPEGQAVWDSYQA